MLRILRLPAVLAGLLVLLPFSASAADTGIALARDVTMRLALVSNDAIMMVYDESASEYRDQARKRMSEAAAPVKALAAEMTQKDAAGAAALAESWRVAEGSLLGGAGYGKGMLVTGYDAKVHADFDSSMQRMLNEIDRVYALRAKATPVETRAHVLVARVVSAYVKVAGSPFGAYTDSFSTGEEDLETQVANVDTALAELARKHGNDPAQVQKLRRLNAKWQFIRTTILKANNQSTPFIVYLHGGDVVRGLAEFR